MTDDVDGERPPTTAMSADEAGPASESVDQAPPRRPAVIDAGTSALRGGIGGDILFVNGNALTIPEVVYPVRTRLAELRRESSDREFRAEAQQLLAQQIRHEIQTLLVYEEAIASVPESRSETIDEAVDRELRSRVSREFGGSEARFDAHLRRFDLTREKYEAMVKRALVAQSFTRERLMPQVHIRRDELLAAYESARDSLGTPGKRELLMIEAPFAAFLPPGRRWATASPAARTAAQQAAESHIRTAANALRTQSFEDVAREYSKGPHAGVGGRWGEISRPLRAPYDELSERIFGYSAGQTSDPIRTEAGWFIVRCGHVTPAEHVPFRDGQKQVRQELEEERLNRLVADYLTRLADRATVSPVGPFLEAALRAVTQQRWARVD